MLEKIKLSLEDPKVLKIVGTVVGAVLGAVVTGFVVKALAPQMEGFGSDSSPWVDAPVDSVK